VLGGGIAQASGKGERDLKWFLRCCCGAHPAALVLRAQNKTSCSIGMTRLMIENAQERFPIVATKDLLVILYLRSMIHSTDLILMQPCNHVLSFLSLPAPSGSAEYFEVYHIIASYSTTVLCIVVPWFRCSCSCTVLLHYFYTILVQFFLYCCTVVQANSCKEVHKPRGRARSQKHLCQKLIVYQINKPACLA